MTGEFIDAAHLAESLDPETRKLWRGILAIVRNDPTTAIRALRHAGQPKALGVAYYLERQYLLFRDQMAEAIRRDPADFGPYYYLGRHYDSDVDDAEQASRWFREALQRNPNYARARSHLGNCLERLGRTEEAKAAYEASASLPLSQLGLGRLMLAAGDSAAALSFVEKALAVDPRDPAALKLAARIYTAAQLPCAMRLARWKEPPRRPRAMLRRSTSSIAPGNCSETQRKRLLLCASSSACVPSTVCNHSSTNLVCGVWGISHSEFPKP